jgi:propanediol dehydratase small subunit
MAKGKHKAAAEKRRQVLEEVGSLESLQKQVEELTAENEKLKHQADIDHDTHQAQMAYMFRQIHEITSPRIQELEEELLRLKKSLRGAE